MEVILVETEQEGALLAARIIRRQVVRQPLQCGAFGRDRRFPGKAVAARRLVVVTEE